MPEARPHTVRALIFDMDGVLADTEPIFFQRPWRRSRRTR